MSTSFSTAFTARHIGTLANQQAMLEALGHDSLESLMDAAVPSTVRATESAAARALPKAATEAEALAELRALAGRNTVRHSAIGLGYHGTLTPAVIKRVILENPSWYTAYTPYQPEISQGRLEALINFQTMVTDLTGMDVANASMLDEGTAVIEAMLLARRASKSKCNVFVVDSRTLPQTKAMLAHRAPATGIELVELDLVTNPELPEHFGVLVQYPGADGLLWDPRPVVEASHGAKALVVMSADLLALTQIESPGSLGADIAVGTTQRFGVPLGFGGPHAAYLAVHKGLERQMPGRLVGVSKDSTGYPAYRLTLQTREQHIRREKATSNICTAQVLLAVMASMYAVYHGPEGIAHIGARVHEVTTTVARAITEAGWELVNDHYFDTLRFRPNGSAADLVTTARDRGVLLLLVDDATVQLSLDETWVPEFTTADALDTLLEALGLPADAASGTDEAAADDRTDESIPSELVRTTEFLTHEVFSQHHSETAFMRYAKRLADKDYALDRGMIPLGSCTMKLNAATEMEAITWPEFNSLHPYAPLSDAEGSLELIDQLSTWLAEVTGYDVCTVQPNSGAQGELTGLMAIRGYHCANGDEQRTICLIPASAHGTNAASAVLAGFSVVVVKTRVNGDVDLDDLRDKVEQHRDQLAALMITYPSTHGVFETEVREVCELVHQAGGQVYIDGANLNALLGQSTFGEIGGDVSHLNLHKTFCIPHGGGGPGVGPVAAKQHLAPYLPSDPRSAVAQLGDGLDGGRPGYLVLGERPISAAPWGSASILPISWAYIRMMGMDGLTLATASAVLAANYVAHRLKDHYPVLFTGENGLVAHECILDLRPLKEATGVGNDDVAKRLIDYGFHAPTMSFPVSGTLMVEPTESEDLAELDRFCDAMIAIKAEADAIAAGEVELEASALANAPHPAHVLLTGEWDRAYTREQAAYPVAGMHHSKYWVPVGRVDNAYGDRNLVCSCPPIEAFSED